MKALPTAALIAWTLFACAPAARQPAEVPQPTPVPAVVPFGMDTTLTLSRVPAFKEAPLIEWGPLPEGRTHAERRRAYDLQHQSTTVRFDWTRHAVVGSTTLTIAALPNAGPQRNVTIDAGDMSIKRVTANGTALRHEYDDNKLSIELPRALTGNQKVTFTVDYEGVNRTKGAYFRPAKHIVWTQGETEDTRYWVPTYDFPNDKTTWEFFIWTKKGERALSNGRLTGSRTVGDSIEWHWVQEKPASTYLMTCVIGNYVVLQDKPWRNVPIGYWTYPDSVEAARRGFAKTPQAVDVFSRKTGVPYPWAKYDQIVIPEFQYGGMENVSATSQNDAEILHPRWSEPQANSIDLMSHELGHQWFGDLLTTRSWAHIWLNEGFATFMEEIFHEENFGADEGAYDRLLAQEQAIEGDRHARRPIVWGKWVNDPIEVFFTGHIYQKGATVLQMLRHQLGDSVFWKGINRYTTSHAYENVVTDDLRKALEETTGRDLKAFFDQWVYGAGFPVFQVSSNYDVLTRRLTIDAREVQARDSSTGFFDVDVDVEARTDSGSVRFVVPVRNGTGEAGVNLKAPPRSIRWDKGNWILDLSDFPRSTGMLQYQLVYDDDVLGRIEAVELLSERPTDRNALDALRRAARNDRFWAVRARAVDALGAWGSDTSRAGASPMRAVTDAIMAATRDNDSRVRQSAVNALGSLVVSGVAARDAAIRLRQLARDDPSYIVRGAALAGDIRIERNAALPLAKQLMAAQLWEDVIRKPALTALKAIGTPEAEQLAQQFATSDQ
ncbi:MAG TPA: M1 family metallopeptidase [Gemmatimonadaceae bacterium]|nr:M1 family metallopeptidase [Gemmatimonadaceae bacterium]